MRPYSVAGFAPPRAESALSGRSAAEIIFPALAASNRAQPPRSVATARGQRRAVPPPVPEGSSTQRNAQVVQSFQKPSRIPQRYWAAPADGGGGSGGGSARGMLAASVPRVGYQRPSGAPTSEPERLWLRELATSILEGDIMQLTLANDRSQERVVSILDGMWKAGFLAFEVSRHVDLIQAPHVVLPYQDLSFVLERVSHFLRAALQNLHGFLQASCRRVLSSDANRFAYTAFRRSLADEDPLAILGDPEGRSSLEAVGAADNASEAGAAGDAYDQEAVNTEIIRGLERALDAAGAAHEAQLGRMRAELDDLRTGNAALTRQVQALQLELLAARSLCAQQARAAAPPTASSICAPPTRAASRKASARASSGGTQVAAATAATAAGGGTGAGAAAGHLFAEQDYFGLEARRRAEQARKDAIDGKLRELSADSTIDRSYIRGDVHDPFSVAPGAALPGGRRPVPPYTAVAATLAASVAASDTAGGTAGGAPNGADGVAAGMATSTAAGGSAYQDNSSLSLAALGDRPQSPTGLPRPRRVEEYLYTKTNELVHIQDTIPDTAVVATRSPQHAVERLAAGAGSRGLLVTSLIDTLVTVARPLYDRNMTVGADPGTVVDADNVLLLPNGELVRRSAYPNDPAGASVRLLPGGMVGDEDPNNPAVAASASAQRQSDAQRALDIMTCLDSDDIFVLETRMAALAAGQCAPAPPEREGPAGDPVSGRAGDRKVFARIPPVMASHAMALEALFAEPETRLDFVEPGDPWGRRAAPPGPDSARESEASRAPSAEPSPRRPPGTDAENTVLLDGESAPDEPPTVLSAYRRARTPQPPLQSGPASQPQPVSALLQSRPPGGVSSGALARQSGGTASSIARSIRNGLIYEEDLTGREAAELRTRIDAQMQAANPQYENFISPGEPDFSPLVLERPGGEAAPADAPRAVEAADAEPLSERRAALMREASKALLNSVDGANLAAVRRIHSRALREIDAAYGCRRQRLQQHLDAEPAFRERALLQPRLVSAENSIVDALLQHTSAGLFAIAPLRTPRQRNAAAASASPDLFAVRTLSQRLYRADSVFAFASPGAVLRLSGAQTDAGASAAGRVREELWCDYVSMLKDGDGNGDSGNGGNGSPESRRLFRTLCTECDVRTVVSYVSGAAPGALAGTADRGIRLEDLVRPGAQELFPGKGASILDYLATGASKTFFLGLARRSELYRLLLPALQALAAALASPEVSKAAEGQAKGPAEGSGESALGIEGLRRALAQAGHTLLTLREVVRTVSEILRARTAHGSAERPRAYTPFGPFVFDLYLRQNGMSHGAAGRALVGLLFSLQLYTVLDRVCGLPSVHSQLLLVFLDCVNSADHHNTEFTLHAYSELDAGAGPQHPYPFVGTDRCILTGRRLLADLPSQYTAALEDALAAAGTTQGDARVIDLGVALTILARQKALVRTMILNSLGEAYARILQAEAKVRAGASDAAGGAAGGDRRPGTPGQRGARRKGARHIQELLRTSKHVDVPIAYSHCVSVLSEYGVRFSSDMFADLYVAAGRLAAAELAGAADGKRRTQPGMQPGAQPSASTGVPTGAQAGIQAGAPDCVPTLRHVTRGLADLESGPYGDLVDVMALDNPLLGAFRLRYTATIRSETTLGRMLAAARVGGDKFGFLTELHFLIRNAVVDMEKPLKRLVCMLACEGSGINYDMEPFLVEDVACGGNPAYTSDLGSARATVLEELAADPGSGVFTGEPNTGARAAERDSEATAMASLVATKTMLGAGRGAACREAHRGRGHAVVSYTTRGRRELLIAAHGIAYAHLALKAALVHGPASVGATEQAIRLARALGRLVHAAYTSLLPFNADFQFLAFEVRERVRTLQRFDAFLGTQISTGKMLCYTLGLPNLDRHLVGIFGLARNGVCLQ